MSLRKRDASTIMITVSAFFLLRLRNAYRLYFSKWYSWVQRYYYSLKHPNYSLLKFSIGNTLYICIMDYQLLLPSHIRILIGTYFPSLTSIEILWLTEIITMITTSAYILLMNRDYWNRLENRSRNIPYHPETIWQNNTFFHFLIIKLNYY